MADSKISALQDGGLPTAGDKFPIARNGENFAIDGANIVNVAQIASVETMINGVSARADAAAAQANAASGLSARLDAAYAEANAAYSLAQQAGSGQGNQQASALAQAAYNQANAATQRANQAESDAQSAAGSAASALARANSADQDAFGAWATANAALAQSNSGNAALALAQAAYNQANTATNSATAANTLAQTAQGQATTAQGLAAGAGQTANTAYSQVNAAYNEANSAYALAQQAMNRSNQSVGSVTGLNGVPRLSNYMINQTDFDDLNYTATYAGGGGSGISYPVNLRTYWMKAYATNARVSTDLTGATGGGSNILANLPTGTYLDAAQIIMGNNTSTISQVGIVNLAGGTPYNGAPNGSVQMNQSVPVCKLFQPGMQHALRASLSIFAQNAAAVAGRLMFGYNTYSNSNILESGIWFETCYNDTNWFLVYAVGSATNPGGSTMAQYVRVDTGVAAAYNTKAQFTQFRLDWDGIANVMNAYINDVAVAQVPGSQMPTNCPYSQGVVGADCRVAQSYPTARNVTGPVMLVDSIEFVAYFPNGRAGW